MAPRDDSSVDAHHAPAGVHPQQVEREAHADGVDRPAAMDLQADVRRQRLEAREPSAALGEGAGVAQLEAGAQRLGPEAVQAFGPAGTHAVRARTSTITRAAKSATASVPASPSRWRRTATVPSSASRSPTTSM